MKQIGPFTIKYDRTLPGWTAVNGQSRQRFTTGAKGERDAVCFALNEAFPKVATAVEHLCQRHAEAASRAWAAAELLVVGHVLNPDPTEPDEVARVRSQRQRRWYRLLRQADGRISCDCPDFEEGGLALAGEAFANQLLCKHLLAYWLACHLVWPLTKEALAPLHPKRSHAGRFRGRAVTAVGQNNRHQLVPSRASPQYGNGQPVLPAHLTHYRSYISYTQQRPFNQEKLLSWSLGR